MARLLGVAQRQGLRRIFVILPFTNIISQSVKTYRKALVLPGEDPATVVAEIHHRADFQDAASRRLTALWDAPVVVTTAVAFFETLASATPSTIRRLQNLPGSAIFVDEAHAMLPAKLLPLAWMWMKRFSSAWSCHWILASGSLCHFWTMSEFDSDPPPVSNIIPPTTRSPLSVFEANRVNYHYKPEPLTIADFVKWLATLDGPVIAVVNTVHTAAVAAKTALATFGEGNVFHLSTALMPCDRDASLNAICARLKDESNSHWCLIATSCVEAGMDVSFRTGVRECASLLSLLQLAGRVNRNGEYGSGDDKGGSESAIWSVCLDANDDAVTCNPAFEKSAAILREYLARDTAISPELCTEAFRREIRESAAFSNDLREKERAYSFAFVESKFKVIDDQSEVAVVDSGVIDRIRRFEDVSWREIQLGSVRVRRQILEKLAIQESTRYPGIYLWTAEYSPFIGYMEGVLHMDAINSVGFAIV
jgi:CRISPR/Cas system-associated endonuclease/helicase Cas3